MRRHAKADRGLKTGAERAAARHQGRVAWAQAFYANTPAPPSVSRQVGRRWAWKQAKAEAAAARRATALAAVHASRALAKAGAA